jgi:hypothetical protein
MVMAVHTSSMRVELLLVVLTGAFGLVAGVSVAVRNSRAEHRRWLRQERLKAYSAYHGIANGGLEAINAMLVAFLHTGQANPQAIVRRAEQTSADLNRPAGSILLLGPEHVSTAAGAVRSHWVGPPKSPWRQWRSWMTTADSATNRLRSLRTPSCPS